MVVIRRRLIFWLIKAYIKKSKKIILLSFLAGLLVFFAIILGAPYIKKIFTLHRTPVIGIAGSYYKENLPPFILQKLSSGLTKVESNGNVKPDLASNYQILDGGKTYKFNLRQDVYFSDGQRFGSKDLNYNFSDVSVKRPSNSTIVFKLKDVYAPFLETVARSVFKKGLIGVGNYFISSIQLNGNFVESLTMGSTKSGFESNKYVFYPTEDSLKTAFMLGEITEAENLTSPTYKNIRLDKIQHVKLKKNIDYTSLVTLFYDTTDPVLSDKKMRLALNYSLPDNFESGKGAYLPYPPSSIFYNTDIAPRKQDLEHAKLLLPNTKNKLTITTLRKYSQTAKLIAKEWAKIGIKTDVKEVDEIPDRFQIFLSDFTLPQNSDQYTIWHSGQADNITKYKNFRIDLLLEKGRKTLDLNERKKIYIDFQKYLLEDMPASFLYFPYEYTVTRA